MIVTFEDRDWSLDLDEIDVPQARIIYRQTGKTLLELQQGLENVDPECMVALYWLMKNQNGVTVDMNKVNFKIVKFGAAVIQALVREADELAANPTVEPVETEASST